MSHFTFHANTTPSIGLERHIVQWSGLEDEVA